MTALASAGCGDARLHTAPVKGKITYKGKPLISGTITFMPEGDKPAAMGEIKADGSYSLYTYDPDDGAVPGKHSIMIVAVDEMKDVLPEARSGTPKVLVPAKYLNFATSGLTAEVKDEPNTFDFELKD